MDNLPNRRWPLSVPPTKSPWTTYHIAVDQPRCSTNQITVDHLPYRRVPPNKSKWTTYHTSLTTMSPWTAHHNAVDNLPYRRGLTSALRMLRVESSGRRPPSFAYRVIVPLSLLSEICLQQMRWCNFQTENKKEKQLIQRDLQAKLTFIVDWIITRNNIIWLFFFICKARANNCVKRIFSFGFSWPEERKIVPKLLFWIVPHIQKKNVLTRHFNSSKCKLMYVHSGTPECIVCPPRLALAYELCTDSFALCTQPNIPTSH